MESEPSHQERSDLDIGEVMRWEVMCALESQGRRDCTELGGMSEVERAKWLFWNLHENLDGIRQLEPCLVGQVVSSRFSICDAQAGRNQSKSTDAPERNLELRCRWMLLLNLAGMQSETVHAVGEGWANLEVANAPPPYPVLHKCQKGYLNAEHTLFANQMSLNGWISEGIWQEIKPHLYDANPACRLEVTLLDNFLFPVRKEYDFVMGPPGAIGATNIEFRIFSHATERRGTRRNETRQLS